MAEAWRGFKKSGHWDVDVNVRDFIQNNYTPYDGDESFLEGSTEATDKLWGRLQELQKEEREHNGVLECETEVVSSLTRQAFKESIYALWWYQDGRGSCQHLWL